MKKKAKPDKNQEKSPDYITIMVEDTKYKTLTSVNYERRKPYSPPDDRLIISVIPGTVVKIHVAEGDQIEAGQKVIILDAMKMKNIINAPLPGRVTKIHVTEGQSIPKGFVMMEVDLGLE